MPKGPNPNHTACRRGTKVIIKPIKGEPIIDIFIERTPNGTIILKNYGRIKKNKIDKNGVQWEHSDLHL